MQHIINQFSTLSGKAKRDYMEKVSFQIAEMIQNWEYDIITNISNYIKSVLKESENDTYSESIIMIKPWASNEQLYGINIFDLVTNIAEKLSIAILDIKELNLKSQEIDSIYNWKNSEKDNPVYKQLCKYFASWTITVLRVRSKSIIEKLALIKFFIRILNIVKNGWMYDFIHNILHTPEAHEVNINFKTLWYYIEWQEDISD